MGINSKWGFITVKGGFTVNWGFITVKGGL